MLLAAGLLLATGAAYAAGWQTVYQTGFDDPEYTLGQTVDGVDGWMVTINPALSTVQKEPDPSTNQFDYISGTSTFSTYRQIPTFGTPYMVRLTFTWVMTQTDVYSNNESYGLWTMFTKTADPAVSRAGMLGGNYDTTSGIGTFKAFSSGTGWIPFGNFALNTPYQLSMVCDMTTKQYDVYVDGVKKLSALSFYTATLDTVSYLHFYRRYKAGYYGTDNISVEAIPEPSSLLALATGLAGLAGLALRRRSL